jgi:hypothetical protein
MARQAKGFLAIWSTVAAEVETDYLHWLTREHVFERVGVDGFHSGRVFKRILVDPSEYFILYELDNSAIVASPQYLDRLNNPTPWSQRIMPILGGFRRGGGRLVAESAGKGAGTFVAVLRFDDHLPFFFEGVAAQDFVELLANVDMISRVRIFSVAGDSTQINTREKSMRRGDESSFGGFLIIEGVNEDSVSKAVQLSRSKLAGESFVVEVFAQVFLYHGG